MMRWRRIVHGPTVASSGRRSSDPRTAARTTPRPILVGVDGSTASTRALEWATVRAVAGATSLHIVHVVQTRVWWPDPNGLFLCCEAEPRESAELVLREAVELARRRAPLLPISTKLRAMNLAASLLDEGRTAELIVLGLDGRRRAPAWLDVSVTARVARRARGRVVLVGPDNEVLV
jgi:nucleotide-binding universal stress UspA family protein